ncbi:FkbM family methyltransferase [Neolewinella agarilytica]|uniref:FkbM family methyltransferase n=1 Tax=Neolewinella agarilytica TaxID=478744 RepID=UPI0023547B59|nr:FkbM family methyltransferase [Neolewinella agarilytica]
MKDRIRQFLLGEKKDFQRLCRESGVTLDYQLNRQGVSVAKAIFRGREYADYFPFYEEATVVDIGAHFGYFALFAAGNLAPSAKIFAVEAEESNVGVLKANVTTNNCQNISIHHLAMAGESGERTLHRSRAENNSLLQNYALLDGRSAGVPVRAVSLGAFMEQNGLDRIDFLKMDCEGAEYEILLNADKELLSKIETISMEFHDMKALENSSWKLVEKLRSAGFQIVKYVHEPTRRNLNYGKLIGTRRLS